MKHIVLIETIAYLQRKDSALRVIDTHAGAGVYDLSGTEAGKTGEWQAGYGRVTEFAGRLDGAAADLATRYLDAVAKSIAALGPASIAHAGLYPGSPLIAAGLLRQQDRLIANELHPEDRGSLTGALTSVRGAKVMGLDGYLVLKSTLPPPERRGVVLIDPPFEVAGEFQRLADGLKQGLRRFANGVFLLWYPIKDPKPVARFRETVATETKAEAIAVEILLRRPRNPDRLNGCGLIIANPPYGLADTLARGLPPIAALLSNEPGAGSAVISLSSHP